MICRHDLNFWGLRDMVEKLDNEVRGRTEVRNPNSVGRDTVIRISQLSVLDKLLRIYNPRDCVIA